jgi:hypothetical protein
MSEVLNNPVSNPEADPNLLMPPEQAEVSRTQEMLAGALDATRVAYHGAVEWIAKKRGDRAGATMERMDHKDALYEHLGETALNGSSDVVERSWQTETMETPVKRTAIERMTDKRLEKRRFKAELRKVERNYDLKAYGSDKSKMSGIKAGASRIAERNEARSEYKAGDITAKELRQRKSASIIGGVKTENSEQRKSRKRLERAEKRLGNAASQPLLHMWREVRRNNAISDIKINHQRQEKHAQLRAEILTRRAAPRETEDDEEI